MALTKVSSKTLSDNAVTSDKIAAGAISVSDMADNSITTAKLHTSVQGALGTRNLIINGDMRIAQKGTSRTYGPGYKSIDRWAAPQYQDAGQQQVTVTDSNVPSMYALRASSSSIAEAGAGSRIQMGQLVESVNSIHCAGKQVTLSFWIRFSSASITAAAGNFGYGVFEYDTADQNFITTASNRSTEDTIFNGSFPTTWTKYTLTATCASTMKNLAFRCGFNNLFNTTNNSDVWYDITGVQLELGDTATEFEHRPYDMELLRCQRYYEFGNVKWFFPSSGATATYVTISYKASKRVSGGISFSNAGINGGYHPLTVIETNYRDGFAGYATGEEANFQWKSDAEL